MLESVNYAAIDASRGLATISINNVGNGFSVLPWLTVTKLSGSSAAFERSGSGIDEEGEGDILSLQGRNATHAERLDDSDSNQQVVPDLMQRVRLIEMGMDWDGDGSPDFDP